MGSSSLQLSKNVAQAMESEKAKLNDVMKNAKANLQRKEVVGALSDEQIKALAVCEIFSGVGRQSRFVTSHNYVGDFMTKIPVFVSPPDAATFVHQGSKGAVLYTLNLQDDRSPSWLLAWSKPEDASQLSKVYVRAGPLEAFIESNIWNGIEIALNNSTNESEDFDPTTGAAILARITNASDVVGSVGALINIIDTPN